MPGTRLRVARIVLAGILGLAGLPVGIAAETLHAYNVDVRETSVSGVSSGAAMAIQLAVAHSSIVKGAGIVAGPPYLCAQGSAYTALSPCMSASSPIPVADLVRLTRESAQRGEIDPVVHLRRQRIWMFSGGGDTLVRPAAVDAVARYFRTLGTPAKVVHRRKAAAEHAMPTLAFGNDCTVLGDPYLNDCDYDAAGKLLQWIYPGLHARTQGAVRGTLLPFDQGDFIANPGAHDMAASGWVFVPRDCAEQKPCRLHVALHGCLQYPEYRYLQDGAFVTFGSTFAEHAGYNEWADANRLIVLYPQAARSAPVFLGVLEVDRNPSGCWDWWGYDDAAYATRSGSQVRAIRGMIDRITHGP
jgi:poly(3-hydroxybutyrate) depolymerase